jgi:hypothetical protein
MATGIRKRIVTFEIAVGDTYLRWAARCAAAVIGSLCLGHAAMADDTSEGVTPLMLSAPQDASPRSVMARSAVRMEGGEVTVSLTAQPTLPSPAQWLIQGPLFGCWGIRKRTRTATFPSCVCSARGSLLP